MQFWIAWQTYSGEIDRWSLIELDVAAPISNVPHQYRDLIC
jgi:hypothetical protein